MIEIYGKSNCKWCKLAVELVSERSLPFHYFDVANEENKAGLKNRLPSISEGTTITLPQIFIYGNHVGGYQEMAFEIENTNQSYGQGPF